MVVGAGSLPQPMLVLLLVAPLAIVLLAGSLSWMMQKEILPVMSVTSGVMVYRSAQVCFLILLWRF